jgi:ATP-dependent Lhr-like helicase
VVIDELHALLDQVRGIHLASLLKRLESASGIHQRLIGLSATLGDLGRRRNFSRPNILNLSKLSRITHNPKTFESA